MDASPLGAGPGARSPLLQTLEDPLRLLQSPLTQLSILGITMGLMTLRYATFFTTYPIVFLATSACVGLLALAHAVGGRNSVIASYALCVALLAQPAAFHFYANKKTPEQLAAGPVVNGQMLFGLPLFVSVGMLLGAQQHLSRFKAALSIYRNWRGYNRPCGDRSDSTTRPFCRHSPPQPRCQPAIL